MIMKIYIININKLWIYRLYEEYIFSIKEFIINNYNDTEVIIITIDEDKFNDDLISNDIFLTETNKIFYSGNFDIYNHLLDKYKKISNKNKEEYLVNKNFFYINIEQMSIPSYYNLLTKNLEKENYPHNIIDYSEENIPFLNNKFFTFLYPPYFKFNNNIKIEEKIIDLLSISNNNYRIEILDNIGSIVGRKINCLNGIYNKIRDEYFYKTKIYINIHCSESHKTMELIRILNLISHKVIVITQKSICSDLLFIKDKIIICNEISQFPEYINEVLNNYEYYYKKFFENFNEIEFINYVKFNLDKIIKL